MCEESGGGDAGGRNWAHADMVWGKGIGLMLIWFH